MANTHRSRHARRRRVPKNTTEGRLRESTQSTGTMSRRSAREEMAEARLRLLDIADVELPPTSTPEPVVTVPQLDLSHRNLIQLQQNFDRHQRQGIVLSNIESNGSRSQRLNRLIGSNNRLNKLLHSIVSVNEDPHNRVQVRVKLHYRDEYWPHTIATVTETPPASSADSTYSPTEDDLKADALEQYDFDFMNDDVSDMDEADDRARSEYSETALEHAHCREEERNATLQEGPMNSGSPSKHSSQLYLGRKGMTTVYAAKQLRSFQQGSERITLCAMVDAISDDSKTLDIEDQDSDSSTDLDYSPAKMNKREKRKEKKANKTMTEWMTYYGLEELANLDNLTEEEELAETEEDAEEADIGQNNDSLVLGHLEDPSPIMSSRVVSRLPIPRVIVSPLPEKEKEDYTILPDVDNDQTSESLTHELDSSCSYFLDMQDVRTNIISRLDASRATRITRSAADSSFFRIGSLPHGYQIDDGPSESASVGSLMDGNTNERLSRLLIDIQGDEPLTATQIATIVNVLTPNDASKALSVSPLRRSDVTTGSRPPPFEHDFFTALGSPAAGSSPSERRHKTIGADAQILAPINDNHRKRRKMENLSDLPSVSKVSSPFSKPLAPGQDVSTFVEAVENEEYIGLARLASVRQKRQARLSTSPIHVPKSASFKRPRLTLIPATSEAVRTENTLKSKSVATLDSRTLSSGGWDSRSNLSVPKSPVLINTTSIPAPISMVSNKMGPVAHTPQVPISSSVQLKKMKVMASTTPIPVPTTTGQPKKVKPLASTTPIPLPTITTPSKKIKLMTPILAPTMDGQPKKVKPPASTTPIPVPTMSGQPKKIRLMARNTPIPLPTKTRQPNEGKPTASTTPIPVPVTSEQLRKTKAVISTTPIPIPKAPGQLKKTNASISTTPIPVPGSSNRSLLISTPQPRSDILQTGIQQKDGKEGPSSATRYPLGQRKRVRPSSSGYDNWDSEDTVKVVRKKRRTHGEERDEAEYTGGRWGPYS